MHFLCGVGQAIRVDVDANATAATSHMFTGLQSPDVLFEVVTAARALKFDHLGIDFRHQSFFSPADLSAGLSPSSVAQARTRNDPNVGSYCGTASLVKPRAAQAIRRDHGLVGVAARSTLLLIT